MALPDTFRTTEWHRCRLFRLNRPRHYLGVALATAAEQATGPLIMQHLTTQAGTARDGAETLGLIDAHGDLTACGHAVCDAARAIDGDIATALDRFSTYQNQTTPLFELAPAYQPVVQWTLLQYPPFALLCAILATYDSDDQRGMRLPDLASAVLYHAPAAAQQSFLRTGADKTDADIPAELRATPRTPAASLVTPRETIEAALDVSLTEGAAYHSTTTYQVKSVLFHAGLLTQPGVDSTRLTPTDDWWCLTDDVATRLQSCRQQSGDDTDLFTLAAHLPTVALPAETDTNLPEDATHGDQPTSQIPPANVRAVSAGSET